MFPGEDAVTKAGSNQKDFSYNGPMDILSPRKTHCVLKSVPIKKVSKTSFLKCFSFQMHSLKHLLTEIINIILLQTLFIFSLREEGNSRTNCVQKWSVDTHIKR